MSDKTITVTQEVESILKTQQLQYQSAAAVLTGPAGSFYADVAETLAKVLRDFRTPAPAVVELSAKDKELLKAAAESRVTIHPPKAELVVGSLLILTGSCWTDEERAAGPYKVAAITNEGLPEVDTLYLGRIQRFFVNVGDPKAGFGGKVVDPVIRVGDTVRIKEGSPTYKPGDTFTVTKLNGGFGTGAWVSGDPNGYGVWKQYIEKVYA